MRIRRALSLAFLLLCSPALAAQLECRVVAISNGDMRGIDAPERKQPLVSTHGRVF